jgi:cob(I)alamin adenosyltransferase
MAYTIHRDFWRTLCVAELSAGLEQYRDNVPHSTAWCAASQSENSTRIHRCRTVGTRSDLRRRLLRHSWLLR